MIINGKEENIATPITVAELIESKGLRADRVAVELNGEIVPRTQRAQTQLKGHRYVGNRHVRAGRLNHFQSFFAITTGAIHAQQSQEHTKHDQPGKNNA